jgi:PST family polysaccharide transporter
MAHDKATRSRASKNAAWLLFLHAANYIVPLIVLPFLVRTLGADNFGAFALSQAIVLYLIAVTDYGFSLTGVRSATHVLEAKEDLQRVVAAVTAAKLLLASVCLLIACGLALATPRFEGMLMIILGAFLAVLGRAISMDWVLQAAEQLHVVALVAIATKIGSLVMLLIFVSSSDDVVVAASIQGGSVLVQGICTAAICMQLLRLRPRTPPANEIWRMLREGFAVFSSRIAVNVYSASAVLVVGAFADNRVVGHFAAAERCARAVASAASPIVSAFYPNLLKRFANDFSGYRRDVVALLVVLGLGFGVVSALIALAAPPVAALLFGEDSGDIAQYLMFFAPLPFLVALGNVLGVCGLMVLRRDTQFSVALYTGAFVGIAAMLCLTYIDGPKGTAVGVLVAEATVIVALTAFYLKALGVRQGGGA